MSSELPVDYDNQFDPDCPKTAGDAIINAVGFTGCISVHGMTDACLFIWDANSAEQLEARLEEMGWELKRKRPWKRPSINELTDTE